ncbi:MAG: hypothetical protein OXU51_14010 [Candidatus Poribacteria bacterium]|nr:hypothetical protein [Candidatus Poribacteria bacterium]
MLKLNVDELKEKSTQRKIELLKLMSEENILLSHISRPESYPDFSGHFLDTVGEALLIAMYRNDCNMVKMLFKNYFSASFLQFQRLKPKEVESNWQSHGDLKTAFTPLLELMDISGYAYLLSDYHETPGLTEPIIEAWDEYFNQDQIEASLQFLANAVSLSGAVFVMAPRDTNRIRWKQIISQRLSDVEREEIPPDPNRITVDPEPRTAPIHQSPLVRIFARHPSYLQSYDGIDIFIAMYIRQREDGENLDFGRRRRDLREEIGREKIRAAGN